MRIPNTAEFLALFVSTGQLTGFSNQPVADLEALAPPCDRPPYIVQAGDTCNSIANRFHVPTYQIMCGNEEINGKCTNLRIGQEICLGRKGEDCWFTSTVRRAGQDAQSLAKEFDIPLGVFEANNYCYDNGHGTICPPFYPESTVCIADFRVPIGKVPTCEKIFS